MRPLLHVLLAIVAAGCAHRSPPLALDDVLSLKFAGPFSVSRGETVSLTFVVRNDGDQPASYCLSDDGLLVWIRDVTQEKPQLVVMHGLGSNAGCWRPERLAPGEKRAYTESVLIPQSLGCAGFLRAVIRVHWQSEDWDRWNGRGDVDVLTPETEVQLCGQSD
jgi:hypothetical protein